MFLSIYNTTNKLLKIKNIVLVGGLLLTLVSCKKYAREEKFPASVTFVNAINDNTSTLYPYFGEGRPKAFSFINKRTNGSGWQYGTNKTELFLKYFLNNDTLPKDLPVFEKKLNLESGEVYTHFLYGSIGQLKDKMIREAIPGFSMKDSVTNVRFINLFENRAVDVVQTAPVAETLASDLKYEELTAFIRIPCTVAVMNYRFEIKDHATGTLLSTLSATNNSGNNIVSSDWLYRSKTLTVMGKWSSTTSFAAKVATVRHF